MAKRTANWYKARSAFKVELMSNAKGMTKAAAQVLSDAANNFVQNTKEMASLPYYTGNTRDSIASAVSASGRIVKANYLTPLYQETNPRWKPQSTKDRKRIIGVQEAEKAVRGYTYPSKGVAAVLFIGVPYAHEVNKGVWGNSLGNIGFIERLNTGFAEYMQYASTLIEKVPMISGKVISKWQSLREGKYKDYTTGELMSMVNKLMRL